MILKYSRSTTVWSPHGFEQYRTLYPQTPWNLDARLDWTEHFLTLWDIPGPVPLESAGLEPSGPELAGRESAGIVLTPGLFAEWLPGCFTGTARALRAGGHRTLISRVRTSRSMDEQAAALGAEIPRWLKPHERFLWLAHSKGVLDALWCLRRDDNLRARCLGLVAMQPPSGLSWVLQTWATAPATLTGRMMRQTMRLRMFRAGCEELTDKRNSELASWLGRFTPPVPMLQAVSWSVVPTSWVDSFHSRLNKLRPGCAHDGQFYLPDQTLPATPTVCLPRLDHAQPVLGGLGLDVGRLWSTLARLLLERTGAGDRAAAHHAGAGHHTRYISNPG